MTRAFFVPNSVVTASSRSCIPALPAACGPADGLFSRIAQRSQCDHIILCGNAQCLLEGFLGKSADPAGAKAFGSGSQHHKAHGNGAVHCGGTLVTAHNPGAVRADDHSHGSLAHQSLTHAGLLDLLHQVGIVHHNETGGIGAAGSGCQTASFQNALELFRLNRTLLKITDALSGFNGFIYSHGLQTSCPEKWIFLYLKLYRRPEYL